MTGAVRVPTCYTPELRLTDCPEGLAHRHIQRGDHVQEQRVCRLGGRRRSTSNTLGTLFAPAAQVEWLEETGRVGPTVYVRHR